MVRATLAACVALLTTATCAGAAAAKSPEIGKTVMVKNEVTIASGDDRQKLKTGAKVHQDEVVETAKAATAEFELLDKTKLAVGPSAKVVLDKFVYDAGAPAGSVSINLSKGAFRFITGLSPKGSYEIKTPTASMGVRGTVFDVYVADNGETVVLLHEGAVDVCPTPTSCRRHDKVGRFVRVGLDRVLSEPLKWTGSVLSGIGVTRAFPFVGKKLVVDPVRRLRHSALVDGTAEVLTAPVKPLRQVPRLIPQPRLPF